MRKGDSHHLSACQDRTLCDWTVSPSLFPLLCFCDIMVAGLSALLPLLEDHGLKEGSCYTVLRGPHMVGSSYDTDR